jgi:hypothetical protein
MIRPLARVAVVLVACIALAPSTCMSVAVNLNIWDVAVTAHSFLGDQTSYAMGELAVASGRLQSTENVLGIPNCPEDVHCCTAFYLLGAVGSFTEESFAIVGDTDLNNLFSSSSYEVYIVYSIDNIDGIIGSVQGAARAGRKSAVVATAESDIWAHGLGIGRGVSTNSTCPADIMYAIKDTDIYEHTTVSPTECEVFKSAADRVLSNSCTIGVSPQSFVVSIDYSVPCLRLNWTEESPLSAGNYTIYRSTSCWGPMQLEYVITPGDPAFTADGIHYHYTDYEAYTSHVYNYQLSSLGQSFFCSGSVPSGPSYPVVSPTNLTAVEGSSDNGRSAVRLAWEQPYDPNPRAGYHVFRKKFAGMLSCGVTHEYLGTTEAQYFTDTTQIADNATISYRVLAYSQYTSSEPTDEVQFTPRTTTGGGYMFLDTNGNGLHDTGDEVNQAATTADVWLDTRHNRDGSLATCSSGGGTPNEIQSYAIILRAVGGTVSWSNFTNYMEGYIIGLGQYSDSIYYANGFGAGAFSSPGKYRLCSVTITPTSGVPDIVFSDAVPGRADLFTSFGSDCGGIDYDNTMKLGLDWHEADGAGKVEQWQANGTPIFVGAGIRRDPALVPDGVGGVIVAWEDSRGGDSTHFNIYAQRLDSTGHLLWNRDGVLVCGNAEDQRHVRMVSDGAGGAIIAWEDHRGRFGESDIYAQRVSPGGAARWSVDGVPICTAAWYQTFSGAGLKNIVADGGGGAIIVWEDARGGTPTSRDIYGQKVSSSGAVLWSPNGVPIGGPYDPDSFDYGPNIVSDAAGGALVTWMRTFGSEHLISQRVDAAGNLLWPNPSVPVGVPVATGDGPQIDFDVSSDGGGGCIVVWRDAGIAVPGVHAQRLSSTGTLLWGGGGVVAAGAPTYSPVVIGDDVGGSIIAYDGSGTIRAQRLTATSGSLAWGPLGIALGSGGSPKLTTDCSGGAVILWSGGGDLALHGQRLRRSNGAKLWPLPSIVVSDTAATDAILSDETGGAVVVWGRWYPPNIGALRAMRVGPGGGAYVTDVPLAPPSPVTSLGPIYPNPFNPEVTIRFALSRNDRARIFIYDVAGRRVRTLVDQDLGPGAKEIRWDGTDSQGHRVASGVYYCRLEAEGNRVTRAVTLLR